jgi:hypothetical protein
MERSGLPARGELLVVLSVGQLTFPVNAWAVSVTAWVVTMEWRRGDGISAVLHFVLLSSEPLVPG